MDAFDIFKKLSKGARFSRTNKVKTVNKLEKCDSSEKSGVKIKEEPSGVLGEIVELPENSEGLKLETDEMKHELKAEQDENGITLLSGLKNPPVRGKKRKKNIDPELKQKKLKIEEVNHYRNQNRISVVGRNIPEPCRTFSDFPIPPDLIANLIACGYSTPTPIQQQTVPVLMEKREILACAPTGSGKTAAFLVPLIALLDKPRKGGVRALILCPTRELAKQTQRECIRLGAGRGLNVHTINKVNLERNGGGADVGAKCDVLVTTPNRLCFLLKQEPPGIKLDRLEHLIIDEADKLFEEGVRSFRTQLDAILERCATTRKIAMFSATYTPLVAKWCVHHMPALVRVSVGARNAACDAVAQKLVFVGNEQGKLLAFRDLVRAGLAPPVLVFVQSKERAQQLFNELIYDGVNVDAIHADRTQLQRDNTVKSFREGKIWVLICTELMARGIDFKGVNLVINYDFPPSAISYVHRVGRAGRAGRTGEAVTFFTLEDTTNLRSIAHVLKESGCEVPPYMLTLKKKDRRERKQLLRSAPKRADIDTRPKYEKMKSDRRKNRLGPVGVKGKKELTASKKNKDGSSKRKLKKEGKPKRKSILK